MQLTVVDAVLYYPDSLKSAMTSVSRFCLLMAQSCIPSQKFPLAQVFDPHYGHSLVDSGS